MTKNPISVDKNCLKQCNNDIKKTHLYVFMNIKIKK